ncbi:hypothetical protein ACGFZQ_28380 [Streptomyces sp. NPDC048254]|uniref:hypothetical protein n=1 Tax=Streptomyces sp. NPDC048254 TaxID=3365525 RepID=UPI00371D56E4
MRNAQDTMEWPAHGQAATGDEAVVVAHDEGSCRGEPLVIPRVDVWRVDPGGTGRMRGFRETPDHIPYGRWTARAGSLR